MTQFRPLPHFDETEVKVAEPAEAQPIAATDAFPRLAQPMPTTDAFPRFAQPPTTNALPGLAQRAGATDAMPALPPRTAPRLPVLLLSGPQPNSVTEQLAALASKTMSTNEHQSLTSALQTVLGTTGETRRVTVIHGNRKRQKAKKAPARHMSLRLRHAIVLFTTLAVLIGFMFSLSPLSDDQNGISLFQSWIYSVQSAFGIQAHDINISKADLNAGLPYMNIPDSPYLLTAEQAAVDAGISPIYFVRQINQESGFNPRAVSVTNAQGIAQFEPSTAASLGVNPWDPTSALRGAARLMASYSRQYGNYAKALAAYNAGSGGLQSAINACGNVNWLNCAPAQTRDYIYKIMGI